jgi:D-3-phosphoglycerate dehydrogenase
VKIISNCDLSGAPEAVVTLEALGQVLCLDDDREKVLKEIGNCDALMAHPRVPIDGDLLKRAPKLKLIGSPHTGRDHLDLDLIEERGITLFHIAEEYELLSSFTSTSEATFALLLALVRKIPQAFEAAKNGNWGREHFTGFQLSGKTLGILGLGRLGTISTRIGQGFAMNVIAHDVRDVSAPGVEMVDFETLLTRSDVLSIHIHLRPETENLIDGDAIGKLKKGAIILNTSRGKIINEAALLASLQSGHLGGAGLDVIDGEWLTPEELRNHPLIRYSKEHENLIIVPHIGGSTTESIYAARVFMARKMADWLRNSG